MAFSLLTWLKVFMSICSHAFISGCVILLETVSIVFKQGVSLFSHLSSHTFRGSRSVRVRDVSSSFLKWQVSPGRQNARVLPAHTGGLVQGPPVSYSSWDGSSGCHHPIYSFCACLSDKFSWWNTVNVETVEPKILWDTPGWYKKINLFQVILRMSIIV